MEGGIGPLSRDVLRRDRSFQRCDFSKRAFERACGALTVVQEGEVQKDETASEVAAQNAAPRVAVTPCGSDTMHLFRDRLKCAHLVFFFVVVRTTPSTATLHLVFVACIARQVDFDTKTRPP